MARQNSALYSVIDHVQSTSANTGDVQTITRPEAATACYVTASTTAARLTFDGSTPSATEGLVVPTGQLFDFSFDNAAIKHASTAGTASVLDVAWLR